MFILLSTYLSPYSAIFLSRYYVYLSIRSSHFQRLHTICHHTRQYLNHSYAYLSPHSAIFITCRPELRAVVSRERAPHCGQLLAPQHPLTAHVPRSHPCCPGYPQAIHRLLHEQETVQRKIHGGL